MKALFVTLDLALFFYNMLGKNSTRSPWRRGLTTQFHGRVFHGYRETCPLEPSPRKSFHASDFKHGRKFAGTIRGDNLRVRITSLLILLYALYILVPVPVEYPPMKLHAAWGVNGMWRKNDL